MPGRIVGVSRDASGRPGLPPRHPDAGAAHPPRSGDQQHLHGPSAARRSWRGCTLVYHGPEGPAADRPAASTASPPRPSPTGCGRWGSTPELRPLLRHAPREGARSGTRRRDHRPRAAAGRDQPALAMTTVRPSASRSTRRPARADVVRPCSRRLTGAGSVTIGGGRSRRSRFDGRRLTAVRPAQRLPHPRGIQQLSLRNGVPAVRDAAPVPRPLPRPVDDPARLVHDEAQRDDGDAAGDLAASSPGSTPSRPPDQSRGATQRAVRGSSRRASRR